MATTKRRLNVSLPFRLDTALQRISTRDNMPVATKAAQLLELALEIEEDEVLNSIASRRDAKAARFVSHTSAWA